MKNQRSTLKNVLEIPAIASHLSGRKPLLTRLRRLLWAAALVLPAFGASAQVVFTNLYSFTGGNDGGDPYGRLVQGSDGYFYGTTAGGGTNGYGTVFKLATNGGLTTLYSFKGRDNDGANPQSSLVQGSDGYFYGTTHYGGNTNLNFGSGYGTVFKISSDGVLTTLYSFADSNDGANPNAGLVQGSDGCFYGTTPQGGTIGYGVAFRISTNGVFTNLHSFASVPDTNGFFLDGVVPLGGLVQGSDGYFYGTTAYGGTNGSGTVFKISTNGVLTTFYSFTGGNDGASPNSLVVGSDGLFYGTTTVGTTTAIGFGNVFKISTNGELTTLYSFSGSYDGGYPNGLVQSKDGNLYGTTPFFLIDRPPFVYIFSLGTVFKISTDGDLTTLYSFSGTNDGTNPTAALVQGTDGDFYGTTSSGGGQDGAGTIFRLTIVPEFQSMTLTNGTLNLTWSTEAGGIYQLQTSASLNTPNWTNLGSNVTATNGTTRFTDAVTNAPQRFYRVSLAQ